jgi:thiamine pyrophosphate-dependent acetolactate synthase large subunit-like protein
VLGPLEWGSDGVAAVLRDLDIPYITINPGASYRGLHDSIVNYLGDTQPEMLLCLHEDHVVSIAHGYAKVTGTPLFAAVHSNVGLMHASMGIFNAWCDRVPMIVLGAHGPADAAKRRPWIEWIHTVADLGAIVRPYTKWDDHPASVPAAAESLLRANQIARTVPRGPVFVSFDMSLQEEPLDPNIILPKAADFALPSTVRPAAHDVERIAGLLAAATHPAIVVGRVSRDLAHWNERIALAERLNATVFTDRRIAAAFPTDHPLHLGTLPVLAPRLRDADVILDLDALELAGALRTAWEGARVDATVIVCSPDRYVHGGWSKDYEALPPAAIDVPVDPDELVPLLLEALRDRSIAAVKRAAPPASAAAKSTASPASDAIDMVAATKALRRAIGADDACLIRLPLGTDYRQLAFHHPLDYLGGDGGGGLGAGPGLAVGSALALRGTSRLPVAFLGDGDYLMGVTALWTAVRHRIPLLVLVANNRSYGNDVDHQASVARDRSRPVERKWIGQRIDDPPPDLAALARAQGAQGIGPVTSLAKLDAALGEAIRIVREGGVCVVDIVTAPKA